MSPLAGRAHDASVERIHEYADDEIQKQVDGHDDHDHLQCLSRDVDRRVAHSHDVGVAVRFMN
jgi:hypothetical protein